jgi:hypothetical protein
LRIVTRGPRKSLCCLAYVAVIEGSNGVWKVTPGQTVPGVDRVDSIVRWGNRFGSRDDQGFNFDTISARSQEPRGNSRCENSIARDALRPADE